MDCTDIKNIDCFKLPVDKDRPVVKDAWHGFCLFPRGDVMKMKRNLLFFRILLKLRNLLHRIGTLVIVVDGYSLFG